MEEASDSTHYRMVVPIVQVEFYNRTLVEESTWKTVFLIQRGGSRDLRGVGIVEVL